MRVSPPSACGWYASCARGVAGEFNAQREGFTFVRCVIPHPFGFYEEPRFTAYPMRTLLAGETARVQVPRYIRDNIPVGLIAEA